jgi:MFS family permease
MSDLTSEQRRILPLVFVVTLTSIMGNSLLSPAIPDILDHFGRPDGDAGYLVAATSLPGIVVAPMIGLLADRLGRRNVLVPCLMVFGIAGIGAATAPTFGLMLLARFVMGFGAAGLVNLAIVLISDHFTGDARTHWIGRNAAVLTAALATFPLLSGLITEFVGWRWALAPYSLGAVTAVIAWRMLPGGRPGSTMTLRQQLSGVQGAIRNPTILATLIGGSAAFALMFGVFLAAMPTHLENQFGLSAGWRGVLIGLPSVTSSLAAFNMGRIRRRIPTGKVLIIAAVAWVIAFAVIGLAGTLWLLIIGTLLYGLGEGVMIPSMQDTALTVAPDEHRASVMATWTGFARLGQTTGPLAAGLVLTHGGSSATMLAGSLLTVGVVAMFALTPIRQQP